jgi:hypothetical protein
MSIVIAACIYDTGKTGMIGQNSLYHAIGGNYKSKAYTKY